MLTVNTIPLDISLDESWINPGSIAATPRGLLRFLVRYVLAAAAAEFLELQPLGRLLLVLGRHVVTLFAFRAL